MLSQSNTTKKFGHQKTVNNGHQVAASHKWPQMTNNWSNIPPTFSKIDQDQTIRLKENVKVVKFLFCKCCNCCCYNFQAVIKQQQVLITIKTS